MSKAGLDPIILGHNQFFGVNHLSAQRGNEQAERFSDPRLVGDLLSDAVSLGAGGFMLSTHQRAATLCDLLRENSYLAEHLSIYPLLPYIQKYVTRANEIGMVNVVFENLHNQGLKDKLSTIWSGGKGVLAKDFRAVLRTLMRFELTIFKSLKTPAIFLHDALTDLALALHLRDVLEFYIDEVNDQYHAIPAFATKNAPTLLSRFSEWRLPPPIIMTHVNQIGFGMNPSRDAVVSSLKEYQTDVVAMGTLASGYLHPTTAYNFVAKVPNVRSVVVGGSSRQHLEETFDQIKQSGIGRRADSKDSK